MSRNRFCVGSEKCRARCDSVAGSAPVRLALKLMNARFDDEFQVEMLDAARSADALVVFNRLWDPVLGVAYGGHDLSDRNLRVLDAARAQGMLLPPLTGTGNVSSGRMILQYARAGCESFSCTPSFSCHSRNTPRPKAPALSEPCTLCCSIPKRDSSPECSTSKRRNSGAQGRRADFWIFTKQQQHERVFLFLLVVFPKDAMPIERIELYELTLPLLEPFIISGGTMTVRRSLVVVLHDDEGHRGYGESPPFELPFYSEETLRRCA